MKPRALILLLICVLLLLRAFSEEPSGDTDRQNHLRYETQKRFEVAVGASDWPAVLALCSPRVQDAVRMHSDTNAFIKQIIPTDPIKKTGVGSSGTSESITIIDGKMTKVSHNFISVDLSEADSSLSVSWRAELIVAEGKYLLDFDPIPIEEQIKKLPTKF